MFDTILGFGIDIIQIHSLFRQYYMKEMEKEHVKHVNTKQSRQLYKIVGFFLPEKHFVSFLISCPIKIERRRMMMMTIIVIYNIVLDYVGLIQRLQT